MKKARMIMLPVLAVALSPLLGACSGLGGQQVTAAEVVQKVRDTMKSTTSEQGTVDLSVNINKEGIKTLLAGFMQAGKPTTSSSESAGMMGSKGLDQLPDSVSATLKYWQQTPDKARVEVVSSSIPNVNGDILVYDGQKVYALDAAKNVVYTATASKMADKVPAQLKALMANTDPDQMVDKIISASDITLVGTEQVNGADAYKLTATPKADAASLLGLPQMYQAQAGLLIKDLKATMWVGKDNSVPVKFTLEHPNVGSITYAVSNLQLNQTIDAGTFVLQAPAGAKTVDLDKEAEASQPKQSTLPDAIEYAKSQGWTLLQPSYLPSGATLVGVTQMQKAMGGGVMLSYSSKDTDLSIMEANLSSGSALTGKMLEGLGDNFSGVTASSGNTTVKVRGVDAKVFSPGGSGWTSLMWQEKDSNLWIAIRGKMSVDEAVKVAEGLK
jgi:outer membrane lipoprotein-sorting protein